MAVKEILQIGHPVLATRAAEIDAGDIQSKQVQQWLDDMIDTMRHANGAGIAANQIGIPYRMFIVEIKNNPRYPYKPRIPLTVVINPRIKFLSDLTFDSNEGCLSVPEIRGTVRRHVEIAVSGYDRQGQRQNFEVRGYSACTFQHEADHLDGILFPHRVTDPTTFCAWNVFEQFQQAEFADRIKALVATWGA